MRGRKRRVSGPKEEPGVGAGKAALTVQPGVGQEDYHEGKGIRVFRRKRMGNGNGKWT